MTAHRDSVTVHRDSVTVHRDSVTAHRDSVTVHRDSVTVTEGVRTFYRFHVEGVLTATLVFTLHEWEMSTK